MQGFEIGTKVSLYNFNGKLTHHGEIVGTGSVLRNGVRVLGWLVKLDQGLYANMAMTLESLAYVDTVYSDDSCVVARDIS